jgi:hypothetical protein
MHEHFNACSFKSIEIQRTVLTSHVFDTLAQQDRTVSVPCGNDVDHFHKLFFGATALVPQRVHCGARAAHTVEKDVLYVMDRGLLRKPPHDKEPAGQHSTEHFQSHLLAYSRPSNIMQNRLTTE